VRGFLRWAFDHYNVDRDRVYLTGLSCGAIGVWSYLNSYVDDGEVVAAVLIAGNGRAAWNNHGCELGAVGVWAFHGTADETVNPDDQMFSLVGFPTDNRPDGSRTESEKVYSDWVGAGRPMTGGLIACPTAGRRDARLTLYEGVGHDSWSRTYDLSAGHDIYEWLLSMSL
jgi:dienelactone hydrolase